MRKKVLLFIMLSPFALFANTTYAVKRVEVCVFASEETTSATQPFTVELIKDSQSCGKRRIRPGRCTSYEDPSSTTKTESYTLRATNERNQLIENINFDLRPYEMFRTVCYEHSCYWNGVK